MAVGEHPDCQVAQGGTIHFPIVRQDLVICQVPLAEEGHPVRGQGQWRVYFNFYEV